MKNEFLNDLIEKYSDDMKNIKVLIKKENIYININY